MRPVDYIGPALLLGFGLGGAAMLVLLRRRKARRFLSGVRALLRASRGGEVDAPRYRIQVVDQQDVQADPQMRWRWLVFDADEELRLNAYDDAADDPEGDLGLGTPYMLGNTSSREFAILAAHRWCREQGRDEVVLAAGEAR